MNNPIKYKKIPREVEALRIVDYVSMKKAVTWIKDSGGTAHIKNTYELGNEILVLTTWVGEIEIPRQYYVIKGDLGGFYSYPADIFEKEYEPISV